MAINKKETTFLGMGMVKSLWIWFGREWFWLQCTKGAFTDNQNEGKHLSNPVLLAI